MTDAILKYEITLLETKEVLRLITPYLKKKIKIIIAQQFTFNPSLPEGNAEFF